MIRISVRPIVGALSALLLVAATTPAVAQTRAATGGFPVYQVSATIQYTNDCDGANPTAWREEVKGWVGRPGTAAAYGVGHGDGIFAGTLWRTVHASFCVSRCPDGGCEEMCRWSVESQGPADVSLLGNGDAMRVGIEQDEKWAKVTLSGGGCQGQDETTSSVLFSFTGYAANEITRIGDISVGRRFALTEETGDRAMGELAILASCADRSFRPGKGARCASAAPARHE
ncbi:MAG TPA: hypothetical protein VFS44_00020 [Gemmatimonadaceae bacterium]|nr:hypothetical protein [Gemmatimonadaceae bacterium]